jgi:hypothetical protein
MLFFSYIEPDIYLNCFSELLFRSRSKAVVTTLKVFLMLLRVSSSLEYSGTLVAITYF